MAVTGRGRPMILIPGLASSGETWSSTVAHLGDRYTCHVITLAGFAGVPPVPGPLLARVRDDLARYIEREQLGQPVIVGHSLGGTLALDLAARYPGRVGPVVIVDSLPFLAGAWFRVDRIEDAQPMLEGLRAYQAAQTSAQYQAETRRAAVTRTMVTSPDDLRRIVGWGLASDRATVGRAMLELLSMDLRADLSRIESPALVLGTWVGWPPPAGASATQTRDTFVRTFQMQFGGLRRMKFVMSDARHFIMYDDPRWFFTQLDRFLADPTLAVSDRGFEPRGSE